MMYQDDTVEAFSEYYYRVRAVDAAGQKGPFSDEAAITTTGHEPLDYPGPEDHRPIGLSPEYGRVLAIDGNPDPYHAWISKPYGGGTKDKPLDVWWQIEFPDKKDAADQGRQDHRRPSGDHSAAEESSGAIVPAGRLENCRRGPGCPARKTSWPRGRSRSRPSGIRIVVPAADLPRSERPEVDGIVRICELLLVLPDGREVSPAAVKK